MITDHAWRPLNPPNRYLHVRRIERPCQFMNCMRQAAEHERAVSGKSRWR